MKDIDLILKEVIMKKRLESLKPALAGIKEKFFTKQSYMAGFWTP